MIYLASPYSHFDPSIEAQRFDAVCRTAGLLLMQGHVVVSPIAHSHPIFVREPKVGGQWEQWVALDHALLDASEEMWILTIPGWYESRGVTAEREYAEEHSIPVKYVTRDGVVSEYPTNA